MARITMSIGSGGKDTNDFIKNLILLELGNDKLNNMGDAAYLNMSKEISFTTDSFVVYPEFFAGGDIGKLAVYGTCNDLAVSGAIPKYISLSFIIPEGYEIETLVKIVRSIKCAALDVGVDIVCGDTKVIERDSLKGLIINTAGVGELKEKLNIYDNIKIGDKVIITSDIARHGVSVMSARGSLGVDLDIKSDCGNLYDIFKTAGYDGISFARDATRGGVAAVLHEIMDQSGKGFLIDEDKIPINNQVKYLCELLGFDPLSIANEGVAIILVRQNLVLDILCKIKKSKIAKCAAIIGKVTENKELIMNTEIGGKRFIEMPVGELLPRIC